MSERRPFSDPETDRLAIRLLGELAAMRDVALFERELRRELGPIRSAAAQDAPPRSS